MHHDAFTRQELFLTSVGTDKYTGAGTRFTRMGERRSKATHVGDVVRALRRARSWSQTKLAEEAAVHLNTVGRFERDPVGAETGTQEKLATALGVPTGVLLLLVRLMRQKGRLPLPLLIALANSDPKSQDIVRLLTQQLSIDADPTVLNADTTQLPQSITESGVDSGTTAGDRVSSTPGREEPPVSYSEHESWVHAVVHAVAARHGEPGLVAIRKYAEDVWEHGLPKAGRRTGSGA